MRQLLAAFAAVTLTGLALVLGAAPAFAHVSLVTSNPSDGASVTSLPTRIRLVFSEAVQEPAYVAVTAPNGSRVNSGSPVVARSTVVQSLKPLSAAGRYTVAYRIISVDGHPVSAGLSFTLAAGTRAPTAAGVAAPPTRSVAPVGQPAAPAPADHGHAAGVLSHWAPALPLFGVVIAGLFVLAREWHKTRLRPHGG